MEYLYGCLAVIAVLFLVFAVFGQKLASKFQALEVERAAEEFKIRREQLEAKFFDMASSVGKPRGLKWLDCDWLPEVTFGRDRSSGMLTAFVAVNIRFEAIEGGDMEEVEAVSTIREAAAVFHYQKGAWGTGGRALFNMNPSDAVNRLEAQYEPVALD